MMGYVRHEHVMRTCMHASLLFVTLTLAIPTTGSAAAVADVCTLAPSISRKCVNLDMGAYLNRLAYRQPIRSRDAADHTKLFCQVVVCKFADFANVCSCNVIYVHVLRCVYIFVRVYMCVCVCVQSSRGWGIPSTTEYAGWPVQLPRSSTPLCIHTHTHAHTHTHTHLSLYKCTRIHVWFLCWRWLTSGRLSGLQHTYTHTYKHVHTQVRVHTCQYALIDVAFYHFVIHSLIALLEALLSYVLVYAYVFNYFDLIQYGPFVYVVAGGQTTCRAPSSVHSISGILFSLAVCEPTVCEGFSEMRLSFLPQVVVYLIFPV